MTRRTVRLVERRTRQVELPRAEVDFLLAHARHVIDVQPGSAGAYRLTPRGFVGFLDGPGVRFDIRPKLPWPNLLMILGLDAAAPSGGAAIDPSAELLTVLTRELAARLDALGRGGFVGGYRDEDRESPFLRGRLRTADHLRDAAARAFPDHFHVTESVFDLDTPWNRIPKAVAAALLARPDVHASARAALAAAVRPLEAVSAGPLTDADFDAAAREPRAAGYNATLALCRLIRDGLNPAAPLEPGRGAFLLDLGRAFEEYLTATLADHLGNRSGWTVEPQARFVLGSVRGEAVVLQPDVVVRRGPAVRMVLDAKWKRPGPDAADLHQILAYAAVAGAARAALVYPGRRSARHDLTAGGVRVSLVQLQVAGPVEECREAAARLARFVRRSPRA